MNVHAISSLTFDSRIKKLFKSGKLKLDYGLYGEPLTKQNVSDEHIICRCYGGKTIESNIALASKEMNNRRGCQPIEKFVTIEMVNAYIERIRQNNIKGYDIEAYCNGIIKTFSKIFGGEVQSGKHIDNLV